MNFEPISLSRKDSYNKLLAVSRLTASDYSFINLWGWTEECGLSWAWEDRLVWIKQEIPEPFLWAP
ncbi:MAG TPA: hypothetical protein VMU10_03300, partial [Desulfomonilia bacterium]|nr:hypothetical protein [Desulfomonilia bacterium]